MKNLLLYLRLSACILWMIAGALTVTWPGFISSLASYIFIVALVIEKGYNDRKINEKA